jgi:hypothetical protein
MYTPRRSDVPGAKPVSFEQWSTLLAPALPVMLALELPKPLWPRLINPAANRLAEGLPARRLVDPGQILRYLTVLQ